MYKILSTVTLFLILTTFCVGQDTRIEIKLNRIPKDMEIISLERKGFLLLYTGGDRRGNAYNSWNITKFNTNFEEQWNKLIDIPSRYTIEKYLNDSISNRFIWVSISSSQLRVDMVDLNDGLNSTQTYNLGGHAREIVSAKIVENNLFLLFKYGPDDQASHCFNMCCFISFPLRMAGLSVFKYGSIYTRIDLKNQLKYEQTDVGKGISIPDKIQNKSLSSETISVSSFKQRPHSHGKTALIVKNLDLRLKTNDSVIILAPENYYLQNIQLVKSGNGIAGVGTFNSSVPEPDDDINTINAQGFYTVIIDSNKNVNTVKIFRFSELKSFEKYIEDVNTRGKSELSESRKNRLKKRYKNYSTLLRFNEIVEREDDFIATAEAFYPGYSSYRDANGNLIQYFEGYNYTHCLILCFDKNGNIKWDKTVPLNFNRLYLNLSQKVELLQNGEDVQLSYGSGGNINVISISGDDVSDPENFKLPRLLKEDEKASEYIADVTPWYGNKYLIWGVKKIKRSDIKDREGSNVIYMDEMEVK
jgi:hypothetical protein